MLSPPYYASSSIFFRRFIQPVQQHVESMLPLLPLPARRYANMRCGVVAEDAAAVITFESAVYFASARQHADVLPKIA